MLDLALILSAWVGAAIGTWSVLVERRLWEFTGHEVVRRSNPLSPGVALRVVLLSDFHFYPGKRLSRSLIRRINALHPHLLLYAGDLIDTDSGIDECVRSLARLHASHGAFAVLGNHDHLCYGWRDVLTFNHHPSRRNHPGRLVRALREVGVEVLQNESRSLEVRGLRIDLVGLGDELCGALDMVASLRHFAPPAAHGLRIVLSHSDSSLDCFPCDSRTIGFAGHTHGGQIMIPGLSAAFLGPRLQTQHLHGWRSLPGGGRAYVGRGLGTSRLLPFRLNARPEVAIFDVVADSPGSQSDTWISTPASLATSREEY